MNAATKHNAMTEAEARALAGDAAVDAVLAQNCEFTNRCIDDVYGVIEMEASIDIDDDRTLSVLYLIDKAAEAECDGELDRLDYSNYTFVIE